MAALETKKFAAWAKTHSTALPFQQPSSKTDVVGRCQKPISKSVVGNHVFFVLIVIRDTQLLFRWRWVVCFENYQQSQIQMQKWNYLESNTLFHRSNENDLSVSLVNSNNLKVLEIFKIQKPMYHFVKTCPTRTYCKYPCSSMNVKHFYDVK